MAKLKHYGDLTDHELCILSAIISDTRRRKWRVIRHDYCNTITQNKDIEILFDHTNGDIFITVDDEPDQVYNVWKFFNKCKDFGVSY